jgi:tetratricopeptide (TPR) repeat protein
LSAKRAWVGGRIGLCMKAFVAMLILAGSYTVVAQQSRLSELGGLQPANSPTPLVAANRLMAVGDFKSAEASLRAYIVTDPRSGLARYMLAYTLLRQNKPKDSLEEYTRAAALQTPSAEQLRNVGQDYVLLNDLPDADKWITRSIEMDRTDPEGWYSLGRLRYTEQRFVDAADCFKHALTLAPGNSKVENNLGLAYEGLNRTDDAVVAYRQAIAWQDAGPRERASEQPFLNLAIVLMHQAQLAEALALLQRAAAIAPSDPRIHEQLGQLYMQQSNFSEAQKSLEIATRLDPGKSNLHFLLGQAYRHLGRQQEAKAEFDAAARLATPSPSP